MSRLNIVRFRKGINKILDKTPVGKTMAVFSLFSIPTIPLNPPTIPNPSPAISLFINLKPSLTRASQALSSSSSEPTSPSPIFLPRFEPEAAAEEEEKDDRDPDDIRDFLESRKDQSDDPSNEGRIQFQKNRKVSWHLADFDPTSEPILDEMDVELGTTEEKQEKEEEGHFPTSDGVVEEVMDVVRNLPENSTIGELLDRYEKREMVGEGECIELLKRMGDARLVLSCLYLFEWMGLQRPSLVTPRSYSVIFPMLGKAGMADQLIILFQNLPKAKRFRDVHVYNSAISGFSFCNSYSEAWKVYESMEANNVKPDNVTCSTMITIMRKNGRTAKEAWDFFQRMNRKKVKLGLETYGSIIKSFCAEGMQKEALIIQSEMERKGIPSNTIIYNTLMDAYVKSNKVEEAEGLFAEMKDKGLEPTTATFNILMDAYSWRKQPEIVEKILQEMVDAGQKANVKSYTCLISAYGRQKNMSDMAADAFLRMKRAQVKPTSHSYTALIHAYSVSGWHEKAMIEFENMKRAGIPPSIETYTTLLDAFRRKGDAEDVKTLMEIWKSMLSDKVQGTRVTFNILLDGLSKHGMYADARDVIHEFGRLGMEPTVMTYNMLMNAYGRGGQHSKLPELLKEMTARNLKPDSITYSTMIYAYIRVRDFKRAFYFHKQMVKTGQVPDTRSYRKLRAILDEKAMLKNRRDKRAMVGAVKKQMGIVKPKGKKDEFWKIKRNKPGGNT